MLPRAVLFCPKTTPEPPACHPHGRRNRARGDRRRRKIADGGPGPTFPRRGRPSAAVLFPVRLTCFDPRPRAAGDFGEHIADLGIAAFRPTAPRRGRRYAPEPWSVSEYVSTHAPAQGATYPSIPRCFSSAITARAAELARSSTPGSHPCRGVGIWTTISNSRPGCEACRGWRHAWGSQAGGARGSAGRSGRWRAWRRHARPGGTSSRPGSNSAGCPTRGG